MSTVGFTSITISWAMQATATGFQSDQVQYTTDGNDYVEFRRGDHADPQLAGLRPAPNGLQSFDLSSITALNNNANAFRIVFVEGLVDVHGRQ